MTLIHQPFCENELNAEQNKRKVNIYFGDARCAVDKQNLAHDSQAINKIKNQLGISQLVLLHQQHSAIVQSIDFTSEKDHIFEDVGDALVTKKRGVSIGVVTADCLPVILYDQDREVIAVAHAGWRGSLLGIVGHTIDLMIHKYGSSKDSIHVFLGPSGRSCCYEVGLDLVSQLADMQLDRAPVVRIEQDFYFLDIVYLNIILLERLGISMAHIDSSASVCTICNPQFCSYRAYGKGYTLRQVSTVSLPA